MLHYIYQLVSFSAGSVMAENRDGESSEGEVLTAV